MRLRRGLALLGASSMEKSSRRPNVVVVAAGKPPPQEVVGKWLDKNFFLLGMAAAVAGAAVAPNLGRDGSLLRPERTIGTYGVGVVFLLSGLSLRLRDLRAAALDVRLNALTQLASLGAIPLLAYPVVQAARPVLRPGLLKGVMTAACLPTTVNMCVILTQSAGGNVAVALTNAVLGNLVGVVATPALLLLTLDRAVSLPFRTAVSKLAAKVLLPVAIGQALRRTRLLELQARRKKLFKRTSEVVLLLIVWNAFCTSFSSGLGISAAEIAALAVALPALHCAALLGFLVLFSRVFPKRDAVAAAFVASQKTLAFGLPLIKTIFADSPDLAAYCAPIMILHPAQLLIGSALVTRLQRYLNKQPPPYWIRQCRRRLRREVGRCARGEFFFRAKEREMSTTTTTTSHNR
ncbi:hypothetical protein CTAYLR_007928 [Chrysophaeum taylorii]|uniref:Uncharacterized protein n=1 Tax=Chrysophaeum taylorii TaxID=2483200 RepID=A0AAD7U963_9STRA|nr:hypothetical protein CTAYLR_007928 [Chrysophaeum taylorii]